MRHCLLNCILHFISLLLLCVRNLLAKFDSSSLENEGIFFAVTQIDVNPGRSLRHLSLGAFLGALGRVVLGADELPRVAQTLPTVGKIERGRVAVKGRVSVAGLLFYLLQPGALQLGPGVAAAQPGPGLGRVIVIKPFLKSLSDILDITIRKVGIS